MWLALGVASLGTAAARHGMIHAQCIGVSLDASRRWVTLTGAHPAFVAAVNREEAAVRLGVDYGTVTLPS